MARRGIPPVRRWRVNYWRGDRCVHSIMVETINKEFAIWMADRQLRGVTFLHGAERVTATVMRHPHLLGGSLHEPK